MVPISMTEEQIQSLMQELSSLMMGLAGAFKDHETDLKSPHTSRGKDHINEIIMGIKKNIQRQIEIMEKLAQGRGVLHTEIEAIMTEIKTIIIEEATLEGEIRAQLKIMQNLSVLDNIFKALTYDNLLDNPLEIERIQEMATQMQRARILFKREYAKITQTEQRIQISERTVGKVLDVLRRYAH